VSRRKTSGWSAAGAARAARECRASIIDFLEQSPVAVNMQADNLTLTYKTMRRLYDPPGAAARTIQHAGLGLTESLEADWHTYARLVVGDEVAVLRSAPLYVMAPSMSDVTAAAAQTLTLSDLTLIDHADLPTPDGLLFLPHPLVFDNGLRLAHLRGLSWHTQMGRYRNPSSPAGVDIEPQLRVSMYEDIRHLRDETGTSVATRLEADGIAPPMLLRNVSTLPFHGTAPSKSGQEQFVAAAQAAHLETADEFGDVPPAQAQYVPGSVLPDPDHNATFRLAYAFFRLAEQRIAAPEPAPVTHSARVAAQRTGTTTDIRVLQLRVQARPQQQQQGNRAVDWSRRWVVQIHKVRQWHPSQQQHKIILRGPYVKGPADKPLGGAEVIRALTR
jgi:hypothetical protein